MGVAHPDLVQSAVKPVQVGYRYEITARSVYLKRASISYYQTGSIGSFPYAQLDNISALNAVLSTNPAPDAQREGTDLWVLTLGQGLPRDVHQWEDDEWLYFPYGIYVAMTGAESDSAEMQALLSLTYVEREHYCPARTIPAAWAAECGPAPPPGPAAESDPWTNQGTEVTSFLITQGAAQVITTLAGDSLAEL